MRLLESLNRIFDRANRERRLSRSPESRSIDLCEPLGAVAVSLGETGYARSPCRRRVMFARFWQCVARARRLRAARHRLPHRVFARLGFQGLEYRITPATLTPVQIREFYGINDIPNFTAGMSAAGQLADGTGQTIAIVDPFDDPQIITDLDQFDQTYVAFDNVPEAGQTLYNLYGAATANLPAAQRRQISTDWDRF